MFCTSCGKEIPNTSKFCVHCGAKVKESTETKVGTSEKSAVNVIFQRRKRVVGCAVPMKIHIDGKVVAVLANGEAKQVIVPSGKHEVIVDMWSAISKTEVDFSAEYSNIYVEVGIKMGLITNKAEILSIRNEK